MIGVGHANPSIHLPSRPSRDDGMSGNSAGTAARVQRPSRETRHATRASANRRLQWQVGGVRKQRPDRLPEPLRKRAIGPAECSGWICQGRVQVHHTKGHGKGPSFRSYPANGHDRRPRPFGAIRLPVRCHRGVVGGRRIGRRDMGDPRPRLQRHLSGTKAAVSEVARRVEALIRPARQGQVSMTSTWPVVSARSFRFGPGSHTRPIRRLAATAAICRKATWPCNCGYC